MQACTIVARNYLAQARVLVGSFRKHHPEVPFTVLVVDQGPDRPASAEDFTVLGLEDIGLAADEARRMALIYDVREFSTAVKPFLLRRLLSSASDCVFYFDPDIEIFAPLFDLDRLAQQHAILLTPHFLEPIPRDGLLPSETDILAAGIYNLGFIAVGPGSETFLDWWALRLRREGMVDLPNMRFTDQRWVDFVPALFSHHILRDPACNVAYWNLDQRKLTLTATGYEVNGRPLRFFHYSGYNPERPAVLSKFQGDRPRVRFEDEPALAAICDEYAKKLYRAGYAQNVAEPYRYNSFGDGVPIDAAIRKIYRAELLKFEAGKGPEPPNAFLPGMQDDFLKWLTEPLASDTALITRYMLGVWADRPTVQLAFPNPLGNDAARFHAWFLSQETLGAASHPRLRAALEPGAGSAFANSPRARSLQSRESVVEKTIEFGAIGDSEPYRLKGWSLTEQRFTWSLGQVAILGLPVGTERETLELELFAGAYVCRPRLAAQRVEVYASGRRLTEWHLDKPRLSHVTVPAEILDDSGLLIIEFRIPDAVAPQTVDAGSSDPRLIGMCLYRLRLMKRQPNSRRNRFSFFRR